MDPVSEIAKLDRMLAQRGEDVVLRRRRTDNNAFVSVICRAKVSGFQADPLVGAEVQQESLVIMSPTQILAAGWPGVENGLATPLKGDSMMIQGFPKTVTGATQVRHQNVTVRIEVRVKGTAT